MIGSSWSTSAAVRATELEDNENDELDADSVRLTEVVWDVLSMKQDDTRLAHTMIGRENTRRTEAR